MPARTLTCRFCALVVIALMVLLVAGPVVAQAVEARAPQRIVHEVWTFKQGAPQAPACFAQTADGYLWVGGRDGLHRFDGTRFELFRAALGEQLQSNNISKLLAVGDGLYVGYLFGGFSFVKSGRVTNHVEPTGTVTGFARDRDGTVWAGASSAKGRSGLWRFDGTSWQNVGEASGLPLQPVAQLGFDSAGTLWLMLGGRGDEIPKDLYFLAAGEKQFQRAGEQLAVDDFSWDADQHVLTAPERAAAGPGAALSGSLPAYPILATDSSQVVDRANGIWLFAGGSPLLHRVAGQSPVQSVAQASRANSQAFDLNWQDQAWLVDREGSLWVGTDDGVHRFSYTALMLQGLPKEPTPWFMAVADEGGLVWISAANGTGESSLYRVNGERIDLRRPLPGVSSFVYRGRDKALWFGGEAGLWRQSNGELRKVELPSEVARRARALVTMTEDNAGGFWVSFGGLGLYRLKDGAWTRFKPARDLPPEAARRTCPRSGVVIAYTDKQDRVWLGCTKGQLTVLDAAGERTFGPGDGVAVGNVTALHGRGAQIWIGGEFGLQQFDEGRIRTVAALDEEALRGISGIVETANGDVWLNGLGGIVHVARGELQKALLDPAYRVSTQRFDRRAGLPGLPSQLRQMPTAIEGSDGRLWFTVINGVVWLDPRAVKNNPAPPVSIQSFAADDRTYESGAALTLPAGTASVRIDYAAISLMNPEATRYRYRLLNVDKDWYGAGRSTSVSYRSLAPGDYRFEVGVTDANGRWSDQTATVDFTVLPSFYQTAWFRALCVALLIGVLWAAYQLRVRHLRKQFAITLDARVAERTRIARELHDTLLQSFHGLLLRFQTALALLPAEAGRARQVLESAIEQAADAIAESRDAVHGLRAAPTETNDLAEAIRSLGENLAESDGGATTLRVDVQGKQRALDPIARDEVFRIAGEALRNAFRHAGAGRIEVELRYDEAHLELRVRDDGKGIDQAVLEAGGREGHFGLSGMRERARLIGGELTVWSRAGAGTEVDLQVPATRSYADAASGRAGRQP